MKVSGPQSLSSGAFLLFFADPVHGLPHWDAIQVKGQVVGDGALGQAWSQGLDTRCVGGNCPQTPSFLGAFEWERGLRQAGNLGLQPPPHTHYWTVPLGPWVGWGMEETKVTPVRLQLKRPKIYEHEVPTSRHQHKPLPLPPPQESNMLGREDLGKRERVGARGHGIRSLQKSVGLEGGP